MVFCFVSFLKLKQTKRNETNEKNMLCKRNEMKQTYKIFCSFVSLQNILFVCFNAFRVLDRTMREGTGLFASDADKGAPAKFDRC